MKLSLVQKREFYEQGFLKLSTVVSSKLLNVALRAINHSIGKGMEPRKITTFRAATYCPELSQHPAILDLWHESSAMDIVESAIAPREVQLDGGGQIALRFPVMEAPGELHPHIDGMYSNGNGVRKGSLYTFTALAGILLSDVPNRFWGNFTVWPGTHRRLGAYFREHGSGMLRRGLPPVKLPQPLQLTGRAGDLILCHYLTAHTVVINVSPYIRYAVFFRLKHSNHSFNGHQALTDIWLEWPGIREAIAK